MVIAVSLTFSLLEKLPQKETMQTMVEVKKQPKRTSSVSVSS